MPHCLGLDYGAAIIFRCMYESGMHSVELSRETHPRSISKGRGPFTREGSCLLMHGALARIHLALIALLRPILDHPYAVSLRH